MVQDVSRKGRKSRRVTNRNRIPETDGTEVIRLSISVSSGKGYEEIVSVSGLRKSLS